MFWGGLISLLVENKNWRGVCVVIMTIGVVLMVLGVGQWLTVALP